MQMLRIIAATIAMGTTLMLPQAQAAEIKLLASNALKTVLEEVVPQFEKSSGHKLTITFGSTGGLTASIDKDVPFDLTILGTAFAIDDLIKQGRLAGPRRDIARTGIGVAYRRGAPKPDVSTGAALKSTLVAAKSLSFSTTGISGSHMLAVIDKMNIAAEVKSKIKPPVVSAADDVAKGIAELGMTQISEILPYAKIGAEFAGPLPREFQLDSVIAAALASKAQQPDAAKAFVDFLTAPGIAQVLKAKGLEPG
jgi:molybdate transport system substrate-binding protein